ncbi:MAG: MlaE family lipid ABC transporter permease subunit [Steroidobacteraceae bacterium]|jgi:phospholipid/cholesterol/gamma-HCH transport system permease protein|nr:MlaE family lipid ABC transporter permease subunit [Steroidobacteraceae bacterium]
MFLEVTHRDGERELRPRGHWRAEHAPQLAREVDEFQPGAGRIVLDAAQLESLDLTGAFFLRRLERRLAVEGVEVRWASPRPEPLEFESGVVGDELPAPRPENPHPPIGQVGRWAVERGLEARGAIAFLGSVCLVFAGAVARPKRFRAASIVRHVYETGLQAVPIVALIAFLISVIIAYIGAQQLRQYGGEIFVVDLVTLAVLRELGVLLTAIIVAGRSGSAFAAEIGVMRLNDEVDALRAIGLNVVEVLVLPRIVGLVIALPMLTIVADAMGLAGGAVLSFLLLDIPFNQFLARMQEAIMPTTFWAGLLKAPVFAFVIALIGTYRGMQVRESSRELGRLTTVAVVQSIFMVIFVNAIFAVAYWQLDF